VESLGKADQGSRRLPNQRAAKVKPSAQELSADALAINLDA
jgi:hypothetical protein